jgi:glycerol-3-phosphate dehydrogenase
MLGTIYDDSRGPVETLVREIMEAGRRAFPWAEIRDEDIRVIHQGHVPGAPNGEPIYRSRLISHSDPRIVSILTAKYTTARSSAEAVIDRLGAALSKPLPPSVSARLELHKARPLTGDLGERLRFVQATEMALSPSDARRGRLIEGALGSEVDSRAMGA